MTTVTEVFEAMHTTFQVEPARVAEVVATLIEAEQATIACSFAMIGIVPRQGCEPSAV